MPIIYTQLYGFGLVGRVVASGPEDLGSIQGRVIPKTFKNGTWYLCDIMWVVR